MSTRAQRYGCEHCAEYIDPARAGIGGAPMESGRCRITGKTMRRVKSCPKARKERAS